MFQLAIGCARFESLKKFVLAFWILTGRTMPTTFD
jgi:hypothetical protein